jgi:3-oxoacyl-[acyl-carrier protein] reductase/meso-butanediol dehydrogenase/(S,S)-butanediol dehydrogenase/diacetyl reductase
MSNSLFGKVEIVTKTETGIGRASAMAREGAMGRIAELAEIANAVAWLMSTQVSYLKGTILSIDGGMSAG